MRGAFILFLLLAACSARQTRTPAAPPALTPFLTSTSIPGAPTGSPQTPEGLVAVETPLPSPTPFTYTVQSGDTISSLALRFGVSMDDLQAANPEISPNSMPIGQVIRIPSNPGNPSGEPTPTPVPFTIQQIECRPATDKGMWCFVLAHNDFPAPLENLSAQVTLVDSKDVILVSQTAFLPLNILPPGTSLPLTVYFPPEVPADARPRVQVLTAIRLLEDDERYLPATLAGTLVQVGAGGHSARVSGQVLLPEAARSGASRVWVAAVAYDEAGKVIGVRRWEWDAGLAAGGSLPFEIMLSSLGGAISRVEFAVEARP